MMQDVRSFQTKNKSLSAFVAVVLCFCIGSPGFAAIGPLNTEPNMHLSYAVSAFERVDALTDPQNRIDAEFKVPARLRDRTAFWFDVYTRYGSNEHIVHHVLYPWLVYKVIDTSEILNSSLPKWTKFHNAENYIRAEVSAIRNTLRHLAQKKNLSDTRSLTLAERAVLDKLSVLPGRLNKNVQIAARNLRVQLGQKDFFVSGLIYSASYLPIMEQEFSAAGLPTELTRLPFVESSFNVKAESKVGASGIWQIMPHTGRQFLTVNSTIDERNSPLKATLVAGQLFKENFRQFKSWSFAITAYNHGGQGLREASRKLHSDDIANLIESYHAKSFKFASSNFFTCFLAALHAQRYHHEIFPNLLLESAAGLEYHVVALEHPAHVRALMKQLSLSREDLLIYNLDLRKAVEQNSVLPRGYHLILPMTARDQIIQAFRSKHRPVREAALRLKFNTSG